MKKILLSAFLIFSFGMFSQQIVMAAPQCPDNATPNQIMSNPACYTSSASTGYNWVDTSYTRTTSCGPVYAGPADFGDYYCYQCCVSYVGCSTSCSGPWHGYWCSNGHGGLPGSFSWNETVHRGYWSPYSYTTNNCHYISSYNYGSCGATAIHLQDPVSAVWATSTGTNCSNASSSPVWCNQNPTVSIITPANNSQWNNTQSIDFQAQGSDPDGDSLTYTWSNGLGSGANVSSAPNMFSPGQTYTVTVTVSDGNGGTTSASVTFHTYHNCSGSHTFNHADLCSGDENQVTSATNYSLVDSCTSGTKCEYTCNSGYQRSGNRCVCIHNDNCAAEDICVGSTCQQCDSSSGEYETISGTKDCRDSNWQEVSPE